MLMKLSSQEVSKVQLHKIAYNLSNSRWTARIENCCLNYYEFKKHNSYIFYSGERDEYYPGVYSIKNDTLFLREFYSDENDPFELLNNEVKFVALLNGNSFQILYKEDQICTKEGHIKWSETILDKKPIYQIVNKLKAGR